MCTEYLAATCNKVSPMQLDILGSAPCARKKLIMLTHVALVASKMQVSPSIFTKCHRLIRDTILEGMKLKI